MQLALTITMVAIITQMGGMLIYENLLFPLGFLLTGGNIRIHFENELILERH